MIRIFYPIRTLALCLTLAACVGLPGSLGINVTLNPTMEGTAQGKYAYLWLGASKDSDARCSAPNCADENINYGGQFALNLAAGPGVPPGIQVTYVEFYMPILPAGTQIVEAHINLYEDSQQVPSSAVRGIEAVIADWDPMAITHANQPMQVGGTGTKIGYLGGFRAINEWRGTIPAQTNLIPTVQAHLASPDTNYGFYVKNTPRGGANYLRSFSSLNERSRTETDLGHSPRLLLKVKLPGAEGYLDDTNVILPALPAESDLDEQLSGPDVLMVRVAGGADWPAAWEVSFN